MFPVTQDGRMPEIDPNQTFIVESRFGGGTVYRCGAGRTEWGEGLSAKVSRKQRRQADKLSYRVTEKPKGKRARSADGNNNRRDSDSSLD